MADEDPDGAAGLGEAGLSQRRISPGPREGSGSGSPQLLTVDWLADDVQRRRPRDGRLCRLVGLLRKNAEMTEEVEVERWKGRGRRRRRRR